MAWFIADATSSERSRGDLRAKGTLFHPLAVQIDALAFVTEVNTCSVTENASGDTRRRNAKFRLYSA